MSSTLWVLVAIKIFIIFWLIYYLFERRKRKGSVNSLAVIEQGTVRSYAGAPAAQASKESIEHNKQPQLYPNLMHPNFQTPAGISDPQSNVMPIKLN